MFAMRYKCMGCKLIISEEDLEDGVCPVCKAKPKPMCENDHICTCGIEIKGGTHVCSICNEFTCECGCHDCFVISRVTGYLAELGGWGAGKRAEFADRTHYDVA
jgi:hypothetical protein